MTVTSAAARVLRPSDVIHSGWDSLEFYSILPVDDFLLSEDWPQDDLLEAAKCLEARATREHAPDEAVDRLTLALLAHGARPLSPGLDWHQLADRLALLYIDQFKSAGGRHSRMRAQRANYCLRSLIDLCVPLDQQVLGERSLGSCYPWDIQFLPDGEVYLASGQGDNAYINCTTVGAKSFRLNYPTQLDLLNDGRIAVGSYLGTGWCEICPAHGRVFFEHARPVILRFAFADEDFIIDVDGGVYSVTRQRFMVRLPVHIAWRARQCGNKVFISDLSAARSLIVLELEGWKVIRIDTTPVLLTNDICSRVGGYYVLDKMQGGVHSFDSGFNHTGTRLSFGKSFGRVCDPIAIRVHEDRIHVLSWLTGKLTTVAPF